MSEEIREEFKAFLEHASPKIVELWESLLIDNPKEALSVIKDYAEYVLPKLARTELTGQDGGDIQTKVTVEFVNAPDNDTE